MSGHHLVGISTYLKVFICLLVLTVVTVLIATPVSGFDAGFLNTFLAFFIASAKASLVALFFMQLKYDKKSFVVIFLAGFLFLLLLIAFLLLDVFTRVNEVSPL